MQIVNAKQKDTGKKNYPAAEDKKKLRKGKALRKNFQTGI